MLLLLITHAMVLQQRLVEQHAIAQTIRRQQQHSKKVRVATAEVLLVETHAVPGTDKQRDAVVTAVGAADPAALVQE